MLERRIPVEELERTGQAFLSGAGVGVQAVHVLEGRQLGSPGEDGTVTSLREALGAGEQRL